MTSTRITSETVKRILAEHVPDCEVRAFGSRATWTAWEYSDLDLAVVSPELARLGHPAANLREAFEESDLPIRVDVVDWSNADRWIPTGNQRGLRRTARSSDTEPLARNHAG